MVWLTSRMTVFRHVQRQIKPIYFYQPDFSRFRQFIVYPLTPPML